MFKKTHSSNCWVVPGSFVVPKEMKGEIVMRELTMYKEQEEKRRGYMYALTDPGLWMLGGWGRDSEPLTGESGRADTLGGPATWCSGCRENPTHHIIILTSIHSKTDFKSKNTYFQITQQVFRSVFRCHQEALNVPVQMSLMSLASRLWLLMKESTNKEHLTPV